MASLHGLDGASLAELLYQEKECNFDIVDRVYRWMA